jgi:F-type H+-transporting ATPase subunit b
MDILTKFGFDLKLFLGQAVNFLILVFIFQRFLYKPILGVLKEREDRIKKGLDDSKAAAEALERSGRESAEILKAAKQGAQEIMDNAKKAAEEIKKEMIDSSRAESEKMIEQARAQAGLEMQKMEKSMQAFSLDLSKKILSSVISTIFTPEDKERVLRSASEKIDTNKEDLTQ